MVQLLIILAVSWLAGSALILGGLVAHFDKSKDTELKRELLHGMIAFSGGILVAAIAFALLPMAVDILSPVSLVTTFCFGGILFCFIDARLTRRGGNRAQFMAMLLDFIPEAISLGAVFGYDRQLGILLAAFIAAQNFPEGFNAYRESVASGSKRSMVLAALFGASLLGPIAAGTGYLFLQERAAFTAGIMAFASGGILYLIFQDIGPQSKMRRHWTPPLGAVLGFVIGMLGKKLIG